MTWERTSRRRAELPDNWDTIQKAVLERDGHQCRIRAPRCIGHATEVDHIDDRHDHTPGNLRAACHPCHAQRTTAQGHDAARRQRAKGRHPVERNPGLL